MKYLTVLLVLALGIVLLIQDGGTASPRGTPTVLRTVPVNVMEVMQPSKMVAVSFNAGGLNQVPVALQVGQVFVLTSWSVNATTTDGRIRLIEGPAETLTTTKDSLFITNTGGGAAVYHQHNVIPTGIRFPRDAGGFANAYVGAPGGNATVSVQGYITDDF